MNRLYSLPKPHFMVQMLGREPLFALYCCYVRVLMSVYFILFLFVLFFFLYTLYILIIYDER